MEKRLLETPVVRLKGNRIDVLVGSDGSANRLGAQICKSESYTIGYRY